VGSTDWLQIEAADLIFKFDVYQNEASSSGSDHLRRQRVKKLFDIPSGKIPPIKLRRRV
jgi:hypothetical protein